MCTHLSNTDKPLCCSVMIWSPLLGEEDKSRAFSLFLCPSLKFWRDCTEDDECSCVGTQRLWFRVWREKSCPNSLVFSWSMTLYATCLWFWRKLEGTKTHVTQAGSAEMISHATPMLTSLCVEHQHTRKSTLLLQLVEKAPKGKNDYSGVSFDELGDICSTLSVKTSHRTSRYLCIATLLESSVQCHVHIGEIFAFYGLHHILCYIMSGYCATTHLGFQ